MNYKLTIVIDEAKLREATGDNESSIEFLIGQEIGYVEDSGIHLTDTEKLSDWDEYAIMQVRNKFGTIFDIIKI